MKSRAADLTLTYGYDVTLDLKSKRYVSHWDCRFAAEPSKDFGATNGALSTSGSTPSLAV
jgi:hypothetical protein